MRRILAFSAIVEVAAGVALMIVPAVALALLAGGAVSDAALPLGRCFGIAILALGIACWPARQSAESRPPAYRGLLIYNGLIALYLAAWGISGHWKGLLLWPAATLHAAVALLLILASRGTRRPV